MPISPLHNSFIVLKSSEGDRTVTMVQFPLKLVHQGGMGCKNTRALILRSPSVRDIALLSLSELQGRKDSSMFDQSMVLVGGTRR